MIHFLPLIFQASSRGGKYIFPQIQNGIISIILRMELSALFCIILDTTLNRSTFLCHKVRENGKTIVRLLCFDAIKGCKAVEIDGTPKQIGLDSVLIRGPAMDGCSTMSGIPGGLQTLVREICQTALSVHHLNLVLVMHTVQVKYLFPVWSMFCKS